MRQAQGHAGHGAPDNMAKMLQQLPAGSLDDLKPGSMTVVTSTRGSHPGKVTGIMVIASVEGLIQDGAIASARREPYGGSQSDAWRHARRSERIQPARDPAMKLLALLFSVRPRDGRKSSLRGTVTDPSGAAVPNASLELDGPAGVMRARTDNAGDIRFRGSLPRPIR